MVYIYMCINKFLTGGHHLAFSVDMSLVSAGLSLWSEIQKMFPTKALWCSSSGFEATPICDNIAILGGQIYKPYDQAGFQVTRRFRTATAVTVSTTGRISILDCAEKIGPCFTNCLANSEHPDCNVWLPEGRDSIKSHSIPLNHHFPRDFRHRFHKIIFNAIKPPFS